MHTTGYMKVIGGHCFKCHQDYEGSSHYGTGENCKDVTPTECLPNCSKLYTRQEKCRTCGKMMRQVKDPVAQKYTGHLWKCDCFSDKMTLSIG